MAHVAADSAAWDNAGFGFTEAGNAGAPVLTRDTAFRNGAAGFAFVSSAAVLSHDLALANHPDSWLGSRVRHTVNCWDQQRWTASAVDTADAAAATAPRGPGGALPAIGFLADTG